MRLALLERGQSALQRALFALVKLIGGSLPGPIATMSYRPEFFGSPMSKLLQASMRDLEHWSVAEAELFAAFVSKQNECAY